MENALNWNECIRQGIAKHTEPDKERATHITCMAMLRFEFWDRKIDPKFSALKVEAYYEVIKELMFAMLYRKGFDCSNHVCLISYLAEHTADFDYETNKIDELRRVRHDIAYRGFNVSSNYLEQNELEFKWIIQKLKEKAEL
ncbi:MAG: hypothetical protein WC852_06820 [Candidatus Nanoarchaeia archaeon]|jgi:hypothetical protein